MSQCASEGGEERGAYSGKHTDYGRRWDKMISISMVEICDTFTRKLQVLLLVMPNGHMSSPLQHASVTS